MRKNYKKKPTRRKPDRPNKQHYFSTVPDYEPSWYIYLYALGIVAAIIGIPMIMAYARLNGWC